MNMQAHDNGVTITRKATDADIEALRRMRDAFAHKPWEVPSEGLGNDNTYAVLFPETWPLDYCTGEAVKQRAAVRGLDVIPDSVAWNYVFVDDYRRNPFGYTHTFALLVTVEVRPDHKHQGRKWW